ncbi:MAG: hypothetical protein WC911_03665 [Thermoleophilia bacterium]
MLPTLEDLGIETHADVKYASGPVDCDGEMIVRERFGELVEIQCLLCAESVCVPVPVKRDMSWRERADLK